MELIRGFQFARFLHLAVRRTAAARHPPSSLDLQGPAPPLFLGFLLLSVSPSEKYKIPYTIVAYFFCRFGL